MDVLVIVPISKATDSLAITDVDIVTSDGRVGTIFEKDNKFHAQLYAHTITHQADDYQSLLDEVEWSKDYLMHKGRVDYHMIYDVIAQVNTQNVRPKILYRWYDPRFEDANTIYTNFLKNQGELVTPPSYFFISGYYKDGGQEFIDYLVTSTEEVQPYDDMIFYYGLTEQMIMEAISMKETAPYDFVITSYKHAKLLTR